MVTELIRLPCQAKSNQMSLVSRFVSWLFPRKQKGLSSVAETFIAAERGLGIDLRSSSSRYVVENRQLVVNIIMLGRNITPTELYRELSSAGICGVGLSRRSLSLYKNRHDEYLTKNSDDAMRYVWKYRHIAELINQSL
jgi:hypothetical protein